MQGHITAIEMEYNCEKCEHVTVSSRALQKHYDEVHVDTNFKCTKCDYTTTSEYSLKEYSKEHESEDIQALDENFVLEKAKLKKELRAQSDSYERLSVLYKSLKAETKTDAYENRKELVEAQENLRVALAENENQTNFHRK